MDRHDERKNTDPRLDERRDDVQPREGDVLGLGNTPVERDANVRRTGKGVGDAGEIEPVSGSGHLDRGKGATGIDMGAGGEGTDIEPKR